MHMIPNLLLYSPAVDTAIFFGGLAVCFILWALIAAAVEKMKGG